MKRLFIIGDNEKIQDEAIQLANEKFPSEEFKIIKPTDDEIKESQTSLYYLGVILDLLSQSDLAYFGDVKASPTLVQLLRHSVHPCGAIELN